MNTTLSADTLAEAPRVLADAAAPVVGALAELGAKDLAATVSDTAANVADVTIDGARTVAEPVRRNPRRVLGLTAVVVVGALAFWAIRRRRASGLDHVDLDRAA